MLSEFLLVLSASVSSFSLRGQSAGVNGLSEKTKRIMESEALINAGGDE